jgi:hypothetical protein
MSCKTFSISSGFTNAGTSMYKYQQNTSITAITEVDLVNAINTSFGVATVDNTVFFQQGSTPASSDFNLAIFTNFWNNNSELNTSSAIDLLTDFIINEGNNAVNKSGNSDPYNDFYSGFANPYTGFIIDMLFCGITPALDFNVNSIVLNNLYHFLNGSSTGDFGGTRGSGTLKTCDFCTSFLSKNAKNPDDYYKYISKNANVQKFCGCCSELLKSQPSNYVKTGSIDLSCQPICFKNGVIKNYNGSGNLVNNGYINNVNKTSDMSYKRIQCVGQTICVIDNPNISMSGGNNQVVFNQICPGCAGSSNVCKCYIDTTSGNIDTITDGVDGLQNSVVFKQNCPISYCISSQGNTDGTINPTYVPCNVYNTADTGKNGNNSYNGDGGVDKNSNQSTRDTYIFGISNWIVPILFFVLGIIVIVCILIVDVLNIKQQIFIIRPKGVSLDSLEKDIEKEK